MNRIFVVVFILLVSVASGQQYHKCTIYAAVGLDTNTYRLRQVQTLNGYGKIVEDIGYTRWMPCNRPYPDSPVERTTYYYKWDTILEKSYREYRGAYYANSLETWNLEKFYYDGNNRLILDTASDSSFLGRVETVKRYDYDATGNKVKERTARTDGRDSGYTLFRQDGLPQRTISCGFTDGGGDINARKPLGRDTTEYTYRPGRMEIRHIDVTPNSKYETLTIVDSFFTKNKLLRTETVRYTVKPTGREGEYFQTIEFMYYPELRKYKVVSGYYARPQSTEVLVYKYD